MNAEQKQQAKQLIADWTNVSKTSTPAVWFLNGDCMAGFLQELVDAHEPDGWRVVPLTATCDMRNAGRSHLTGMTSYADSTALKVYGAMLAAAPPAPSVPDVVQTIPSHDQITQILNGLDRCGVAESKRAFLRTWIRDWTAHKLSAAPTPAEAPADVARDAWYGSNPPSLVQATAIYMALLEAAQNPRKLSDERILELFYEHATPDRWPFGFARAIGAAMREKGQS